jgi:uncharacterized protein YndB with AHSA1/START domain
MNSAVIADSRGIQRAHSRQGGRVVRASARAWVDAPRDVIFAVLRDLTNLPAWWPSTRSVAPLPPGVSGRGGRAIVAFRGHSSELRVVEYRPPSRLLLALSQRDRASLLLGVELRECAEGSAVEVVASTVSAPGWLHRALLAWRLRRLVRRSARSMKRALSSRLSRSDAGAVP